MSCAPFCYRPRFPLASGLRASTPPPISLTACPPRLPLRPLHTTLFSVPLPATITFVCLGALATPTQLPLLLISLPPVLLSVSSWVTPLSIRGTVAWTSLLAVSSSLATSCLTSRHSLSPPPPPPHLLLTLRRLLFFPLTRWFHHRFHYTLQVLLRHALLVVLRARTLLYLARQRQPQSFLHRYQWLRCLPLCPKSSPRSRDRAPRPHLPGASASSTSGGESRLRLCSRCRWLRRRPRRYGLRRRPRHLRRSTRPCRLRPRGALAPSRRCTTRLYFTGILVTLTQW